MELIYDPEDAQAAVRGSRLLGWAAGRSTECRQDGFAALATGQAMGSPWILAEVERAGLRGRGGAGFPTGLKMQSVAAREGPRYVLANGEEGEPASWKDRYLLRRHPEVVLEGVVLACLALDAHEAWVYVADPEAKEALDSAVGRLEAGLDETAVRVRIVRVPATYVAGEESAAIRFINGGPALPTDKPPRPYEEGIRQSPTFVGNVETFAHLAWIVEHGASSFRELGTEDSPGTFLACVAGDVDAPQLVEVPYGTTIQAIVDSCAPSEPPAGVLLGGYFSGFLPAEQMTLGASDEMLRPHGLGLGNGTFVTVGRSRCLISVFAGLMDFFASSSAGQCGPCVRGTAVMAELLDGVASGSAPHDAGARLDHYGTTLLGRGACNLLDGAARLASQVAAEYRSLIEAHLGGPCPDCARTVALDPTRLAFTRNAVL